ncbi:hypothetical protein V6N13_032666 [Hibiscus sabdariffa]
MGPPAEVFEARVRVWKNALVAQFLGKPPNLSTLHRLINVFRGNVESLRSILLFEFICVLCHWNFLQVLASVIASALGVPLYMDSITANRQRLAYAKVCVEMSADFCVPKVIPVYLKDGSVALVGAASEIVPDVAGNIVQDVMDMVVQGAEREIVQGAVDYAQVQVSAIDLDVGAATHNVIGVEQENASTDEFIGVVVAPEGTCGSPKQIREAAKGVADLMQEIKNAKRNGKKGRKKGAVDRLRDLEIDLVYLVETRVKEHKVQAIWNKLFSDWVGFHNYASLDNGRVWILCKKFFRIEEVSSTKQSITYLLSNGSFRFFVSGIYGCNLGSDRLELWQHLAALKSDIGDQPWLVGGGFNVVRSLAESSKDLGSANCIDMDEFNSCLDSVGLVDHSYI